MNILRFPVILGTCHFNCFSLFFLMKTWIINWGLTVASWYKALRVANGSSLHDTIATSWKTKKERKEGRKERRKGGREGGRKEGRKKKERKEGGKGGRKDRRKKIEKKETKGGREGREGIFLDHTVVCFHSRWKEGRRERWLAWFLTLRGQIQAEPLYFPCASPPYRITKHPGLKCPLTWKNQLIRRGLLGLSNFPLQDICTKDLNSPA